MNGDRNKLTLAILAGVWGVLVLGLGYFLWDASSKRGEAVESLEGEEANLNRYYGAKVFPSAKSSSGVNANAAKLKAWREAVAAVAGAGDKTFDAAEGASAFKERLLAEVRAMQSEPVSADKKVCASGFLFGFERYLGEANEMPKNTDVPLLQVELDFVRFIVERLAETRPERKENGKSVHGELEISLDGVERLGPVAEPAADVQRKQTAKKPAAKKDDDEAPSARAWRFRLALTAKPVAFVKFLNALAADPRFTAVSDLTFRMKSDPVTERFTAADKSAAEAGGGRRGRRGRRGEAAKEETPAVGETVSRLVTEPTRDAVYSVNMEVILRDFGSREVKTEDVKEGGK